MMKQQLSLILLFTVFNLSAQVDYYSDDVFHCIEEINLHADSLANAGDIEEGMRLRFESIPNCIILQKEAANENNYDRFNEQVLKMIRSEH